MIIDAHAHVTYADYGSAALLTSEMDKHGIDRAVLFPGGMIDVRKMTTYITGADPVSQDNIPNELVESLFTAHPDKFYGFYCVNPNHGTEAVEGFRQAIKRGFSGLKLAPIVHRFALNAKVVHELAAACGELDVPLYSHVVFSPGASTEKFGLLAQQFPKTKFILGHMGFGPADVDAVELAYKHENIFLESSGGSYLIIKSALDRVGPSKLIYGSEFPMQHPQVELEKIRLVAKGEAFSQITSKTFLSLIH